VSGKLHIPAILPLGKKLLLYWTGVCSG